MANASSTSTYILGLDSATATYVTDYINAIVIFVIAEIFRRIDENRSDKHLNIGRQTSPSKVPGDDRQETKLQRMSRHQNIIDIKNSITGALFACGFMHFIAGVAHHFINHVQVPGVRQEADADLLIQVIPLYFAWHVAKLFATAFAVFLALTSLHVLVSCTYHPQRASKIPTDNRRYKSNLKTVFVFVKKRMRVMENTCFVLLLLFCVLQACTAVSTAIDLLRSMQNPGLIEGIEETWTLSAMVYLIGISLLIYTVNALLILADDMQMSTTARNSDPVANISQCDLLNSSDSGSASPGSSSKDLKSQPRTQDVCLQSRRLRACTLRCVGLMVMIASGLTQYFLSFRCGFGASENVPCPLPPEFNHNAVYHSLFMIGLLKLCFAEYCNLNEEIEGVHRATIMLRRD